MDFKKEDFIKMKSFEGITFLGLRHTYFDDIIEEEIVEEVNEVIEEAVKEEDPFEILASIPEKEPEPPKEKTKQDKIDEITAILEKLKGE